MKKFLITVVFTDDVEGEKINEAACLQLEVELLKMLRNYSVSHGFTSMKITEVSEV